MHKQIIWGALAALFASLLALDATTFGPTGYPLYKKLFDGDWQIVRNASFGIVSVCAAICSFMAVNVKNDK